MHFEILVEDQSGKQALEFIVPRITSRKGTYRIIAYKGIGRIPKDFTKNTDARKRLLLDQLPRLLGGYGKAHAHCADNYRSAVIVVCDLDDRCKGLFRDALLKLLNACYPKPNAYFCFAIEEGEAWFLGDIPAVKKAYPKARDTVLNAYANDCVCGTWERLADAVTPGGSESVKRQGGQAVGKLKREWSNKIAPHMNIDINKSPSFCYFRNKMHSLLS